MGSPKFQIESTAVSYGFEALIRVNTSPSKSGPSWAELSVEILPRNFRQDTYRDKIRATAR
jgi:hypothetical protein